MIHVAARCPAPRRLGLAFWFRPLFRQLLHALLYLRHPWRRPTRPSATAPCVALPPTSLWSYLLHPWSRSRCVGGVCASRQHTPAQRVVRLAVVADLEIHPGLWGVPGAAVGSNHLAGVDPPTDFPVQALVVSVKRHIAIPMFQNQE